MLSALKSHIDNSICLDVVHVRVPQAQLLAISLCSADDASGDSVLEGKGASNRNYKLSWPQVCTVAQKQYRQLCLRVGNKEIK